MILEHGKYQETYDTFGEAEHFDKVSSIFSPRIRTHLTRLTYDWPEPGFIGLPITGSAIYKAEQYGINYAANRRPYVSRKDVVKPEMQEFSPLIAKRHMSPIPFELSPISSAASSLQNLLTTESYSAVEMSVITSSSGICDLCGCNEPKMHAQEIWSYKTPDTTEIEGIQKLENIMCVCESCKSLFDYRTSPDRETTLAKISQINSWSSEELDIYKSWSKANYQKRVQYDWVLDLKKLKTFEPIAIHERWSINEKTWRLNSINIEKGLKNNTLPLNIEFSINEFVYRVSSDDFYSVI